MPAVTADDDYTEWNLAFDVDSVLGVGLHTLDIVSVVGAGEASQLGTLVLTIQLAHSFGGSVLLRVLLKQQVRQELEMSVYTGGGSIQLVLWLVPFPWVLHSKYIDHDAGTDDGGDASYLHVVVPNQLQF